MPDESALSLVERLRAALDRDEETARAATPGPWRRTHPDWPNTSVSSPDRMVIASAVGHGGSWPAAEDAAHIAANGPDAVLRTVAAHRKILTMFEAAGDVYERAKGTAYAESARCVMVAYANAVDVLASIYFPEGTEP